MPTTEKSSAQTVNNSLLIINELAERAAQELGLILLDLRLNRQGKQMVLEITIHRQGEPNISFADCEQMSRLVGQLLEIEEAKQADFLAGPYLLEVVSPGTERQLTKPFEFTVFAGKQVRVLGKKKIDSLGDEFIGILARGDEHSITITQAYPYKTSKKTAATAKKIDEVVIDLQDVYRVNLWTA